MEGPGKVVFQDGKIVFVRHGSVLVRVSVNRIVKKGEEYSGETNDSESRSSSSEGTMAERTRKEVPFIEVQDSDDEHTDDEEMDTQEEVETNNSSLAADNVPPASPESRSPPVFSQTQSDTSVYQNGSAEHTSVYQNGTAERTSVYSNSQTQNDTSVYNNGTAEHTSVYQNGTADHTSVSSNGTTVSTSVYQNGTSQEDPSTLQQPSEGEADESTVIESNGKRKRKEENLPVKRSRQIAFPPSVKPKMNLKRGDLIEFGEEGRYVRAKIVNREKATGKFYNYFNVECEDGTAININGEKLDLRKIEEEECHMVLIPQERHQDNDCLEAKQVELGKLKEFSTYEEVDDVGQNRVTCRWVLWYKGEEVRARLTARGFQEQENVPSDSPTVDKCNVRIALTICAAKGWEVETSDVKSAFLQGHRLEREVFVKPPKEAEVANNKLWKLNVALYGLNDAGLQFFIRTKKVLQELGCEQSKMDPALFFKRDHYGKLEGLICTHVDDFIHGGTKEFKNTVVQGLINTFQMGKTESKKFRYVGFDIEQKGKVIRIDQSAFAADLKVYDLQPERARQTDEDLTAEEKSTLRAISGKIGWLGRGTRPDLLFSQVEMSTKFVNGKVADLSRATKVIRKAKDSRSFVTINDIGEDENEWCVEVSTDAALCNLNEGVNSTAAKVILLVNRNTRHCAPISWQCNKIPRVVDSTLAAECLSQKDGLCEGGYVREVVEELLGMKAKSLPVYGIVDNRGVVDAIHSTTNISDKKLRRDVAAIKQMINEGEVTGVSWCSGKDQLADCMTKRGAPSWDLVEVFQSGVRPQR